MDFEHRHETFKEYLERLRKHAVARYVIDKESGRINNRTAQYKKRKRTKNITQDGYVCTGYVKSKKLYIKKTYSSN
jgi:hypothetical protein